MGHLRMETDGPTMSESDFRRWSPVVEVIARRAGSHLLSAMRHELQVNEATQHDLKIQLDVETQNLIEAELRAFFPGHHILGEEGGSGNDGKGIEWIIDPIDGTVNLVYGIPHFCVSIGCRIDGQYQLGVIYDPSRDECFTAVRGMGAFLNGNSIRVSVRKNLSEAILSLGFSKSSAYVKTSLDLVAFYSSRVRKLRALGSAALDMAYVAAGRMDGYIEQGIRSWDIAAGVVLIEEAGGKVVLTPHAERESFHIVASNGTIPLQETGLKQ